ncbi:MAG: hypothetical protein JWM49_2503 [Microbacteriaceae bacterium]|nr:hypothetical protein [Microbacteriaceae bacterium]
MADTNPAAEPVEHSSGETRDRLTGDEGGRWRVVTRSGSNHLFDLDAGTVERIPGPNASTSINDTCRLLRTIERCEVGSTGGWTMKSVDFMVDFYWQVCTVIVRIERLSDPAEPALPRPPLADAAVNYTVK